MKAIPALPVPLGFWGASDYEEKSFPADSKPAIAGVYRVRFMGQRALHRFEDEWWSRFEDGAWHGVYCCRAAADRSRVQATEQNRPWFGWVPREHEVCA